MRYAMHQLLTALSLDPGLDSAFSLYRTRVTDLQNKPRTQMEHLKRDVPAKSMLTLLEAHVLSLLDK